MLRGGGVGAVKPALHVAVELCADGWRPFDARAQRWRNVRTGAVVTRAELLARGLALVAPTTVFARA